MIGRRMVAATAVVAAVAAGGVTGALIGIPGLSAASTTSTSAPKAAAPKAGDPKADHARRGFGGFGAGKGVLDAGAKALNLSTADLLKKLSDGKTTIAAIAAQQHVDPQAVIDAMTAVAKTDITNFVNNPFPKPPAFKGGKGGNGGKGGPGFGMRGPGFGFGGGDAFGTAAKALGITTKELLTDLRDGKSIADIAKTKGKDINAIINGAVTDATTKIDAAVKAGKLDADRATKIKAGLKDLITKLVNGKLPKGGGGFGGFGHRGGHGPGSHGPTSTTKPPTT